MATKATDLTLPLREARTGEGKRPKRVRPCLVRLDFALLDSLRQPTNRTQKQAPEDSLKGTGAKTEQNPATVDPSRTALNPAKEGPEVQESPDEPRHTGWQKATWHFHVQA